MSLEIIINQEIKTAMLAKDEVGLRSLRAIKSAIIIAKTAEGAKGTEMSNDEEIKLLQKLVKQRKDSLEIFEKQNRPELAAKEKEEIVVIEKFLPIQLSDEDLKQQIAEIIKTLGVTNATEMGKVIGVANKQLAGIAEGKRISLMVKELLS